jgi:tryptophan-rich sensory protein
MNSYLISFILLIITIILSNQHIDIKKNSEWYKCIRPKITPPEWIFGLIWTFIYILLFFAFANILETKNYFIISLFIINLILQVLWTCTFFNVKRLDAAFLIIQFLILTTSIIISLSKQNVRYLLYPYLGWLTFGITLNILAIRQNC